MSKLDNIYRQIPKSICPPDCGKCCGLVYPSMAEIRNIKDWCARHNRPFHEFDYSYQTCPYLADDKSCSIYPVRPFLCRMLGVVADLPCPTGECKPEKLLNPSQGSFLYREIYLRGKEKPRTEKHRALLRNVFERIMVNG